LTGDPAARENDLALTPEARVARRITNNPDCDAVAEYLESLERAAR
jgi:hypothetical protein